MNEQRAFRPKIGGVGQHVTHPAKHHGYRHLVASRVLSGSMAYYIEQQCAKAKKMDLPDDIISFNSDTGWYMTIADINVEVNDGGTNRMYCQSIEDYVWELKRYNDAGGR